MTLYHISFHKKTSLYFIISHYMSSNLIPQKYFIIFHFPCHFITRSPPKEGSLSRQRRKTRTESEEQRRKDERARRRYEHEERMAAMREEASKNEEEQKRLDAESNKICRGKFEGSGKITGRRKATILSEVGRAEQRAEGSDF